jgi:hypothetical protein
VAYPCRPALRSPVLSTAWGPGSDCSWPGRSNPRGRPRSTEHFPPKRALPPTGGRSQSADGRPPGLIGAGSAWAWAASSPQTRAGARTRGTESGRGRAWALNERTSAVGEMMRPCRIFRTGEEGYQPQFTVSTSLERPTGRGRPQANKPQQVFGHAISHKLFQAEGLRLAKSPDSGKERCWYTVCLLLTQFRPSRQGAAHGGARFEKGGGLKLPRRSDDPRGVLLEPETSSRVRVARRTQAPPLFAPQG